MGVQVLVAETGRIEMSDRIRYRVVFEGSAADVPARFAYLSGCGQYDQCAVACSVAERDCIIATWIW